MEAGWRDLEPSPAWLARLVGEDYANFGVAFVAGVDADYVAAQAHGSLQAVGAWSFHDYLKLGLEAGAVLEGDHCALEREVAYQGFFVEGAAAFGYAGDSGVELGFAAQGSAGAGHVGVYAAAGGAQGYDQAFAGGEYGIEFFAGLTQDGVDHAVGGVGIVVEEHQRFGVHFAGDADAFSPGGMAPAAFGAGELLWRVLGVVDEDIRACRQLLQTFVEFAIAGLVVGGVDDGAGWRFDAETEAALWMIQGAGGDFVFAYEKGVASSDFLEPAFGIHGGHVDRKIGQGHLSFEDLLEAVAAEVFGAETVEVEFVFFDVERGEEGDALDVVPVVVGDEDVGFWDAVAIRGGQAVAQHAEAGAAVENDLRAVWCDQLQTGGVAAVAPGGGVDGRRGAPDTPEA
jgi:hypothetical protein